MNQVNFPWLTQPCSNLLVFFLQSKLCSHCNCHPLRQTEKERDSSCGSRKQSLISTSGVPPPPPPPAVGGGSQQGGTPPPPPPPPVAPIAPLVASLQPMRNGVPPPPCPPPPSAQEASTTSGSSPEPPDACNQRLLPQQEIPTPKAKMKTINWNKIPNNKVRK